MERKRREGCQSLRIDEDEIGTELEGSGYERTGDSSTHDNHPLVTPADLHQLSGENSADKVILPPSRRRDPLILGTGHGETQKETDGLARPNWNDSLDSVMAFSQNPTWPKCPWDFS